MKPQAPFARLLKPSHRRPRPAYTGGPENRYSTANGFQASVPQPLFPTGLVPIEPTYLYDVSADGRRFVLLKPVSSVALPLKVAAPEPASIALLFAGFLVIAVGRKPT